MLSSVFAVSLNGDGAANSLLGPRTHPSLKPFMMALPVLDDMGAIPIIALFCAADLKRHYLALALIPLAGLVALTLRGAHRAA